MTMFLKCHSLKSYLRQRFGGRGGIDGCEGLPLGKALFSTMQWIQPVIEDAGKHQKETNTKKKQR